MWLHLWKSNILPTCPDPKSYIWCCSEAFCCWHGFMISAWFYFMLSRLKLWRRWMKITCRIMERNCPRFPVMETHLYMMNSTEFVAADETKHRFTASDYVGAVINVNCQCQESVGWEYQYGKHSKHMVMPQWFAFFLTCPTHQAGTVRMDCHYHFEQIDSFTNCPLH